MKNNLKSFLYINRNLVIEGIEIVERDLPQGLKSYFLTIQFPKSFEFVTADMCMSIYRKLQIESGRVIIIPEFDRYNKLVKGDYIYSRIHLHAIAYTDDSIVEKVEQLNSVLGFEYVQVSEVYDPAGLRSYLDKQSGVKELPKIYIEILEDCANAKKEKKEIKNEEIEIVHVADGTHEEDKEPALPFDDSEESQTLRKPWLRKVIPGIFAVTSAIAAWIGTLIFNRPG